MSVQSIANGASFSNPIFQGHIARKASADIAPSSRGSDEANKDIAGGLDSGSGAGPGGPSLTSTAQGGIYQAAAFLIDLTEMIHAESHGPGQDSQVDYEGRILADIQAIHLIASSVQFRAGLRMNRSMASDVGANPLSNASSPNDNVAAPEPLSLLIIQQAGQAQAAQANLSSDHVLALLGP